MDAISDDETETQSPTATDTETPSPTETETATDSPDDTEVPFYIDLLPNEHLGGTERTPNANFVRVDWEWYLRMMDQEMTFGVTSEEDWTLEPNAGNFQRPPQYDIIQAPVGGAIRMADILIDIIGEFPNAGPEIIKQAGLEEPAGQRDSSRKIDEIIGYAKPGVTYITGVDLDAFRDSVAENPSETFSGYPDTVSYQGTGRASGRNFIVSEAREQSIIAFESADQDPEDLSPTFDRLAMEGESVAINESVSLCLPWLIDAPVVVGEINGGRQQFGDTEYEPRPVEQLSNFDTIFHGFKTDSSDADAQVVTSSVSGKAPQEKTLRDVYEPEDGDISSGNSSKTSYISSSWQ